MYHFTYITASKSGHYYVGRHSTSRLNDGYLGSGKWVRYCMKKGIELHRKIIYFYNTFEELLDGEKQLIDTHIRHKSNMNISSNSIGFATGDLNPAKSAVERKRRSENNWMKSEAGRKWISENNPSKNERTKKIRSNQLKTRWLNKEYREKLIENHHAKTDRFKQFISLNNPMKRNDVKDKIREHVKRQVVEGRHSSQIKACCITCRKTVSISNLSRWHKICISNSSFL